MAIASLEMMGELELMGRNKAKARKFGRALANIATGGASAIAFAAAKKRKAKMAQMVNKRVAAAIPRMTVAARSPLAVAAPVASLPVSVSSYSPVSTPSYAPAPSYEPEPEPVQSYEPEPSYEPEYSDEPQDRGLDPADEIELMGRASKAKRRKVGKVFAAIATGGASAAIAKSRKRIRKQTAGMSKAQKKTFLKRKIARGMAIVGTGGVAAVAMRRKPKPSLNPMARTAATASVAATRAFPAKTVTPVTAISRAPVRVATVNPFPAVRTPGAFGGPMQVRHMSVAQWAQFLFTPTLADNFQD